MSWQAAALLSFVAIAQGSQSVSMADDPYHRLLLENSAVCVFAVEVPPLKPTLSIRHENNYIVIYRDSTVVRTIEGFSPMTAKHYGGEVRLFYGKRTIVEKNDDGVNSYRNVTVEVLKKIGEWSYNATTRKFDYPPTQLAPPLGVDSMNVQSVDMRGVIAGRIQLMPSDTYGWKSRGPALLVALSKLELMTDQKGRIIREEAGNVAWFAEGVPSSLTNIANNPARMVVLEF